MVENKTDYTIGSIVELKKPHACATKNKNFEVIRVGADIKIKCLGCGHVIMIDRAQFNERIRKIIKK
ncbi:MAG: DUF951 domain-containing protein [Bacilli bacterium]|nr:DUF951 domain-containing protein [Bacilli bacterium]MDY6430800.1 DUF951 domain-containing protein [Bacilli bacterium]